MVDVLARGLAVITCVAMLGCDGGSDTTWLEFDVIVERQRTLVYAREPDRPCTCTGDELPGPGECVVLSDAISCSCEPPPASCLEVITIERDGQKLTTAPLSQLSLLWGVVSIPAALDNVELVLDGCGGSARIPITAPPPGNESIESIANDESQLLVSTMPGAVTDLVTTLDSGFGGPRCRTTSPGQTGIDGGFLTGFGRKLTVLALDLSDVLDTGLGIARVWHGARDELDNVFITKPVGDGTWQLPYGPGAFVTLVVDGEIDQAALDVVATVDPRGDEPLFSIASRRGSNDIEYRAGATTDTLVYTTTTRTYTGELPHVTPDPPAALGSPEWTTLSLATPTTTLVSASDPNDTIELSVAIDWPLGVVSAPLAP